jgi:excisionase family DNA binding protein
MDPEQQFLPLLHGKREAARIIGISLRTLHSLIATNRLRPVRIGRRVLVPHAELVRFCSGDHPTSQPRPGSITGTTKRTRNQFASGSAAQSKVNRAGSKK